jgi:arsenate reductase-like glutaredoxin family protein
LIDEHGVENVMNRRSPAYKELGLDQRTISKNEALELMAKDVNLIRRPLLLKGRNVIFGFDADEYGKL